MIVFFNIVLLNKKEYQKIKDDICFLKQNVRMENDFINKTNNAMSFLQKNLPYKRVRKQFKKIIL